MGAKQSQNKLASNVFTNPLLFSKAGSSVALNILNKCLYNTLKICPSERIIQKYFFLGGEEMEIDFFSIIKHCPSSITLFSLRLRVHTERRETAVEELACTLKGILHMAIPNDTPLKIQLSYGCVSLVKRVTFLHINEIE